MLPSRKEEEQHRERWYGRITFIFATVGSATGKLGNIWRFPFLVYKFGGLAFFIPYILALLFVGLPILILEFALGQVHQSGDIASFGKIHKRLRGIGLGSVWSAFTVTTYYNAVISWAVFYFFNSFQWPLPWGGTLGEAQDFLLLEVLQINKVGEVGVNGFLVLGLILTWVVVYLSIFMGPKYTGKVVWVTLPLPIICLLILFFFGITLPGAGTGLTEYIGKLDPEKLANPSAWSEAIAQTFFTLGITFGIMTAYSSYNRYHQNVVVDAIICAVSDTSVSILAGLVVFSVLGFVSQEAGIAFDDMPVSGPLLVFVAYPVAMAQMPAGVGNLVAFLFFLSIFFLAIDSAFSLVEAVVTALHDSRSFKGLPRWLITAGVSLASFLIGIMYTAYFGLFMLDSVDWYLNNCAMFFIGFMECISVGWIYKGNEQIDGIGLAAVICLPFTLFTATLIGTILAFSVEHAFVAIVVSVSLAALGTLFSYALCREPVDGLSKGYYLFWYNPEEARLDINAVVTQRGGVGIPAYAWSLMIKYVIPVTLVAMLGVNINKVSHNCNCTDLYSLSQMEPADWSGKALCCCSASAEWCVAEQPNVPLCVDKPAADMMDEEAAWTVPSAQLGLPAGQQINVLEEYCGYELYGTEFQVVGVLIAMFGVAMVLIGMAFPQLLETFMPDPKNDPQTKLVRMHAERAGYLPEELYGHHVAKGVIKEDMEADAHRAALEEEAAAAAPSKKSKGKKGKR